MGRLAVFFQQEFERLRPDGWICRKEVPVFSPELERVLGYAARADVLLESNDNSHRYWIEFEISRADPVANHAKFATGHLFSPRSERDLFISMVSPHVARGRRNLAANTINLMRRIGMNAFQTVLLPHVTGNQIKQWNTMPAKDLAFENIPVHDEIDRLFAITQPIAILNSRSIHLVGDMSEVLMNIRRFNLDMTTNSGRLQFGRRTVTYFVYDPFMRNFAPSKYCAYSVVPSIASTIAKTELIDFCSEMTVELYSQLDGTNRVFDGRIARVHLEKRLSMQLSALSHLPHLHTLFDKWLETYRDSINIHPNGAHILTPPSWF